ncbi:phosphatidylinositol 4-phosphate 5-kinase 6-like [Dorcoceras hygrometricum]|uniref:Phosphatidylinositol 4-phosphate 5-kinase 6-like n=1 Tax=Dorcoceras hygrometricum TaxID=472368 RepID=A0A2Z6ZSN0_9LAMI|nr:phosphatidylinositol 4-phosphate 5-kinase 6-like [Dorcoceras hygrometricum]
MRCSAARNATPRKLLRCWMGDAAGLLLRIIVQRCAAPTPPAACRLCDAGSLMCARPRARVRSCGALDFSWRRPPLRRRSGDVVTAGLNSSRVLFGPVPGSP